MKDIYKYALVVALVFVILGSAFILNPNGRYGGSDDAGSRTIMAINPSYVRWIQPLWTPPPETESGLFALQAAIGGSIIGYFIGVMETNKKKHGSAE